MAERKKVLVVEDEPVMREVLVDNLEEEGYEVLAAADGEEGRARWTEEEPDLVLLDVMLPLLDGFSLCEAMRAAGAKTPILFLSAKGTPEDRVRGLASGGDDYLVKPFHLPELLLRVQNMLQRQRWEQGAASAKRVGFGGHEVDWQTWEARLAGGRQVLLHKKEFELLRFFVEHAGEVVDREALLDAVWADEAFPSTRALERHVQQLREIFEPDAQAPIYFHSLRGARYRFTPEGGQS